MDVNKLAALARIRLSEDEKASLSKEFEGILKYVDQIQEVKVSDEMPHYTLRNVFRQDSDANVSGACTETLLSASPDRQGDYFKVKKIL